MKLRPRLDANHHAVVDHLRERGCSVSSLAALGGGVPDLLVGYRGLNVLLEVKDGSKPPSARKLTPDEQSWHAGWSGRVLVVYSPEDAWNAVVTEVGR